MSLGLILILLYIAFRSFLDAIVIFTNVFDVAVGGVWALYLTGTTFSVSAAVGFISLFGIAIMDGLLLIAYFNALRAEGLPLHDAIMQGAAKRVRPVMITAHHGDPGPFAGGPVHQDRLANVAAASDRGHRWDDADLVREPLPDAGAVHLLRQPHAPRRQR